MRLLTAEVGKLKGQLANVREERDEAIGKHKRLTAELSEAKRAQVQLSADLQAAQARVAQLEVELNGKVTELVAANPKAVNKDRYVLTLAPEVTMEFVRIPAGEFLYGDDKRKLDLPEYWLGKTVVTTAQYLAFVKAMGNKGNGYWNGDLADKLNYPAVYVSWGDAQAFCRWVSKVSKLKLGLPSEQQWEKGARGTDGREYPWGNEEPSEWLVNYGKEAEIETLAPVGSYSPEGDSLYGLEDMAGNVWEWCEDWYDDEKEGRVLRGGAFYDNEKNVRCAFRGWDVTDRRGNDYGFRVMLSPPL